MLNTMTNTRDTLYMVNNISKWRIIQGKQHFIMATVPLT